MSLLDVLTSPFRRKPRRPLAARRPGRDEMGQVRTVPLGMEATDLGLVNNVARQNDALERATPVGARRGGSFAARASTDIDPMPEDETYSARYHRAYQQKET
mmetsp:Transcript_21150/g.33932  ORF Transcript_21150/g.33932 Transcript_21150/m.33932 type:complete len:102 (+) Transcript_21150:278-583(+)